ncbi:DNA-binding transcriptional regulator, MarR family [Clostridium cavendishii DSM 21758]|uniref:DNA-binding transcriptional regulator, MarR family n=1 Tax=Clostridium cavendishii DSM 21758 TaxID=1121302 RepID=A0A1M6CDV3_9CLOT|nr:MarR family transcriptional regulator [Clostridium cavendishii]SHI59073.1 DNA-binding transcriptional regulator, MarR family [Clostridium cavendishii DSM 21758]
MITNENFNIETLILNYIDEFKFLLFPDQWSNAFLDYSKNEVLAILLIYRQKSVTMSDVAEYINAPLNTATGVISRLEKKEIVERKRDAEDKRVVNITLTDKGSQFVEAEKGDIEYYIKKIYEALTEEEKKITFSIVNKVISVLKEGKNTVNKKEKVVKKVKRINIE